MFEYWMLIPLWFVTGFLFSFLWAVIDNDEYMTYGDTLTATILGPLLAYAWAILGIGILLSQYEKEWFKPIYLLFYVTVTPISYFETSITNGLRKLMGDKVFFKRILNRW